MLTLVPASVPTLTLSGMRWTGIGVDVAGTLIERAEQRGDDRGTALAATSAVIAHRACAALINGQNGDARTLAGLATALRHEALSHDAQAAWDATNECSSELVSTCRPQTTAPLPDASRGGALSSSRRSAGGRSRRGE
ncbi:hypothetical protein KIN34_06350 [Cellulomonas sp. DKR-3]|uniref:Uncharacterized protein n=1 Tax=Cellulomonas fulva TaxID=2835530 RepID=A0ABS5TXS9_9CELL|nr:hypothetical protein [Cellulomonas fulva]MBT0993906.1 hypothetical protein [Cellulomonas fulva]